MSLQTSITEFTEIKELCKELVSTKYYAKLQNFEIFAIVQKASILKISPLDALNGGLYCVHGRIEMASILMNRLIRQAGHSITCSEMSDKCCTLTGTRTDGDSWTVSFNMEQAKRANIVKNGPWTQYPDIMLFNRCLSRLARCLFPDVIHGCYVEGEIPADINQSAELIEVTNQKNQATKQELLA